MSTRRTILRNITYNYNNEVLIDERIIMPEYSEFVRALCKPGQEIIDEMTPQKAHLDHMQTGVCTEAGELADAIKKHVFYGKELDLENVVEEIGDCFFYLQGIMNSLGIEKDWVIDHNVSKLSKRYASLSYSNEQAIKRDDKNEAS